MCLSEKVDRVLIGCIGKISSAFNLSERGWQGLDYFLNALIGAYACA
jgi:hypothetical protein